MDGTEKSEVPPHSKETCMLLLMNMDDHSRIILLFFTNTVSRFENI